MTNANTKYHPLLPKTTENFPGGPAAGQWNVEGVSFFNRLANSLDFESNNCSEINSIPNPWSRALQFMSAMRNDKYPSREWLIAQYRGFLATIALSENLKLPIDAIDIDLNNYQNIELGRCLEKLKPNYQDNIFVNQNWSASNNPWSHLYLFQSDKILLGFTSPATLIVPIGHIQKNISHRIPWVKDNIFVDPIENGLTQNQKSILAAWLNNLSMKLGENTTDNKLAAAVVKELNKFRESLGTGRLENFEPSEQQSPFGKPLSPSLLTALHPAKAIVQESNVRVYPSQGLSPSKPLYIIDPDQLPAMMGRDVREINVIGSSSLFNFDPNLHRNENARFLFPHQLFTENLFYTRSKGLLPGTWLDRKLNIDNLTIFLPLNPDLKDYFNSQDLENQVQLSSVSTPEGPGVRVTLSLKLSGLDGRPFNYQVYKDFSLKAENELKQAFPTLALWPNVPPESKWKEYFVLLEVAEGFGGLAFKIEQPTDGATQEIRKSGQETYQYQ